LLLLLPGVTNAADSCYSYTYKDDWDTSLIDPITVREVFHIIGENDSTSYLITQTKVADYVAQQNITWATAKITFDYTINWIPNTFLSFHMGKAVDQDPSTYMVKYATELAPDSQMQVYVYATAVGFHSTSPRVAVVYVMAMETSHVLAHEGGHVFGLYHTFAGVGAEPVTCYGASAEVSQLATDDPRNSDSARGVNGDKMKDTPAQPAFNASGVPKVAIDPCTDSAWGTLSPYNVMAYTCPDCDSVMTPHQAMTVRCWVETHYPGWIKND
jgi:hypothetical protein